MKFDIWQILEVLGLSGIISLILNKVLNRKKETVETANLIREGEILKVELRTSLDKKVEDKMKFLEGEIDKSRKEIEDLNIIIAQMAIEKIKDDRKGFEKMADMEEKIQKLIVDNQLHIDRELKCLERLGELTRRFNKRTDEEI